MTAAPTATSITDLVWARAQALSGINWYRSEVPDHPPALPDSDRVAAYAVLYPFPGKPGDPSQGDLAGAGRDIDWGGQITVAAGFSEDCEHAVDLVFGHFYHWAPVIDGVAVGWLTPPVGYDPGPVRIDRSVLPPRFSVPLQYRLTATAT